MDRIIKTLLPDPVPYRFERKYYTQQMSLPEVESLLRCHPGLFKEIYHARTINNIYFDSINRRHYFDNINGNSQRYKVRMRWYGEASGDIAHPALEVKVKEDYYGCKLRYALKTFSRDGKLSMPHILQLCEAADVPLSLMEHMKELRFTVLTRYQRKYFLSADKAFRVTVDTHLQYYRLTHHNLHACHRIIDRRGVVVELKYAPREEPRAVFVANHFPFRLSRMSKYISGVQSVYV